MGILEEDEVFGDDGWEGGDGGGTSEERISETHVLNTTTVKIEMQVVTMVAFDHEPISV